MLTFRNISNISLPEISLPEISLPEISLPEISLPEISLPLLSVWGIDFSFILLLLPFITFIIKGKHDTDLLKDDIQYLLLFKEKYVKVDNLNERLLIKSQSLKKKISENMKKIESKDHKIKELEDKIDTLTKERAIKLPLEEPDFGKGLLRICNGGVYFHGVCHEENQKWNENNKCSKYIYEYKSRSRNRRYLDKYKTYNIDDFCNNCLLIEDKNKYKVFQCQGHEY